MYPPALTKASPVCHQPVPLSSPRDKYLIHPCLTNNTKYLSVPCGIHAPLPSCVPKHMHLLHGKMKSSMYVGCLCVCLCLCVCMSIINKICPLASVASFGYRNILFRTIRHIGSNEMISFWGKSVEKYRCYQVSQCSFKGY